MVSNKAASSVEKAHATVQIKCKFQIGFCCLTPSEQERYEPQLEMTFEEKSNFEIPPATQKPYSAGTYKSQYRYVLPDKKQ